MIQLQYIKQISNSLSLINGVEAAILYGSFARQQANAKSDVDIYIWISKEFSVQTLIEKLKNHISEDLIYANIYELNSKVIFYFRECPKIEILYTTDLKAIERYFIDSMIADVEACMLYVTSEREQEVRIYLEGLIQTRLQLKAKENLQKLIIDLCHKFIYDFESCSVMHFRSDAYQYYFLYNIALHTLVQIKHLTYGNSAYNFLPKRFCINNLEKKEGKDEQKLFYNLNGDFQLTEANEKKRRLLDFFYDIIQGNIPQDFYSEVKDVCEKIYQRDYYWNFRDLSQNNHRFREGFIYRCSALCLIKEKNKLTELITEKHIESIIDLRSQEQEIDKQGAYSIDVLEQINYVHTPLDPWRQPDWFIQNYHYGTDIEIAYRFFVLACKKEVKKIVEVLLKTSGAVVIHCFAGKDRTGTIIALLALLVDTPKNEIYIDYLASECDAEPNKLDVILDEVEKQGGIIPYLLSCDLTEEQIHCLKRRLIKDEYKRKQ